ncbi:MAG: mechanosensitive ion channel family protein [Ilumatobacteraceae bacterium]
MIRIPNGEVLKNPIVTLTRNRCADPSSWSASPTTRTSSTRPRSSSEPSAVPNGSSRRPSRWCRLTRFGESTIDITIYYWHRSEVPAELAATHDLMLAVHQALAAAGITIAFPQMVVWSGHDADPDPYGRPPGSVATSPTLLPRRPNRPTRSRPSTSGLWRR